MLIHAFLYDAGFANPDQFIGLLRNTGGFCIPSAQSLTYFVEPVELIDVRPGRNQDLNVRMTSRPQLILDENQYNGFLSDYNQIWSASEQAALFTIIDQLAFSYSANASAQQIELVLNTLTIQYVPGSYVLSNTTTQAQVYTNNPVTPITCPDYISFSFIIANRTQYQFRIWLNSAVFHQGYPIATVSQIIPPLPLDQLYTLSIANGLSNTFNTALVSSQTNQQALQSAISQNRYSGYCAYDVIFVDGAGGNTTMVQFNILYNGQVPGAIAIRLALRNYVLNSGVGTNTGWKALIPSIFVTERWYLLGMFNLFTNLLNSVIYPNIVPFTKVLLCTNAAMYDITPGWIAANTEILTSFYNKLNIIALPDPGNDPSRVSLLKEHPTYQEVSTTNPVFASMTTPTQQFATLLAGAISIAFGNTSNNQQLVTYTQPGDNRNYVVFNVGDIEYYVMTKASYVALAGATL